MRIACYCRVSTEEQARHGLSIETQLSNLREWANQNQHTIVKEYVDAGVSGKKPYSKRPALSEFVRDLESGLAVDALVFCKLDRFFRSVKHYYQIVAIMDKYRVGWQTIHEEYETLTSQGQFMVNLMLSIAEAEATRTSERIKIIMDAKRERKEPTSGHVPIGYKIEGKKIVKDESKADIVLTLFDVYQRTGSIKAASDAVEEKTGYHFYYRHASDTLKNESYFGRFYGIDDYAPAYIDKATFDRVQQMRRKVTRTTKYDQIYLFSGLLVCGLCGGSMSPRTQRNRRNPPSVYNCRRRYEMRICDNGVNIDERDIEAHLLSTLSIEIQAYNAEVSKEKQKDTALQIAALSRKKERVKDMYVAGVIDLAELKERSKDIEEKLAALSIPCKAKQEIELPSDWRKMYDTVGREEKKAFWRSVIKEIRVYPDRHIEYELL